MTCFAILSTTFLAMALPGSSFSVPKLFGFTRKTNPSALNNIPDGYVGGFAESNPGYAYPKTTPDLSDIPIMSNYDNIDKLTRMQKVLWPEFSWETVLDKPESRVYMKWATDISRMGYTDDGRIYSIICPQQGHGASFMGELNIEATVTGCRGWCKEDEKTMYADMGVMAQIWYTPDPNHPIQKLIAHVMEDKGLPVTKAQSIKIPVHNVGQPWNPTFNVQNGTSPEFRAPSRSQHDHEAYGCGHLTIEIDEVIKTGDEKVDDFNEMIVRIFNIIFGNMLQKGSRVSWNVWTGYPETVDQEEWATHSERWRLSLDEKHTYPDGSNKFDEIAYYDGTPFSIGKNFVHEEVGHLRVFLAKHKKDLIDKELEAASSFLTNINDTFFHGEN